MKLGLVIYSNDSETVWNAFRFAHFSVGKSNQVKIFLLGKGVESESLDTDKFNITAEINKYINAGGKILACGTCLKLRSLKETDVCPISTLSDLYDMITESDKVLTF